MMRIENTTGRLLEPVYLLPQVCHDVPVVLPIYHTAPAEKKKRVKPMVGVPPGVHEIDEISAAILEAHKPNQIFFTGDGGQPLLKISEGSAVSQEDDERHQPVLLRCRSEAIAAWQRSKSSE